MAWLWRTVLLQGLQLLDEVGPRGFTVRELANRVGVARSTLYKYFGMKAELMAICMERYAFGGPDHERVAGRIAYKVVLEGLANAEAAGGDGPLLADLLATYVGQVAQSRERDLWLLAAAEAVRSPRPPRSADWPHLPVPVRSGVRTCVAAMVRSGRDRGTAQAAPSLTNEALATVLYAISAFTWYEACLGGPRGDHRRAVTRRRPKIHDLPPPFPRGPAPTHPRGSTATCRRAIEWLLHGAGMAQLRLPHLPPLRDGRLDDSVRKGHPTGIALHELQEEAWLFDLDDMTTLLPASTPMSPPLVPPPRLPTGLQTMP